jgi:D-amino-acid dehydrogenase
MNQAEDPLVNQPPHEVNFPQGDAYGNPRRGVIVVGGGAIGAACASFLKQAGFAVQLLEQGSFGKGCSHGNCGYVSPSHILPLCQPGAIGSTLKTFFQWNSPFQLRFRWDRHLWSWLWQFARHCNRRDMLEAGHARHALLTSSRSLYGDLIGNGVLSDCEWETRGLLFVYGDKEHFEAFAKTDQLLRSEFGLGAKALSAEQLLDLEPALKPVVAGAWHYECDAHLRPDKLMQAWQRRLAEQQIPIRENCQVLDLEGRGNAISAVVTNTGRIEADQVVFATGAWSRLLQKRLKTKIPIEPGKGYSITMRRPARCPVYPMIFEDRRVAITPMASGYRVGSTMEFAGFDRSIKQARLNLLTEGARHYLHEPLTEPFVETWYGWRPMSCDGVPLIGRLPRWRNGWLAAGHSMLGISMATGTGKLIAELLSGAVPHIDPHYYRLERFR